MRPLVERVRTSQGTSVLLFPRSSHLPLLGEQSMAIPDPDLVHQVNNRAPRLERAHIALGRQGWGDGLQEVLFNRHHRTKRFDLSLALVACRPGADTTSGTHSGTWGSLGRLGRRGIPPLD